MDPSRKRKIRLVVALAAAPVRSLQAYSLEAIR